MASIDIGKEILQVAFVSAEKVVVLASNSVELISLDEANKVFTKLTSFASDQ